MPARHRTRSPSSCGGVVLPFAGLSRAVAAHLQYGRALDRDCVCGLGLPVIIPQSERSWWLNLDRRRTPDPALGKQAKQRSLHNKSLTSAGDLPDALEPLSAGLVGHLRDRDHRLVADCQAPSGSGISSNTHHRERRRPRQTSLWTWGLTALSMGASHMALLRGRPSLDDADFTTGAAPVDFSAQRRSSRKAVLTLQGALRHVLKRASRSGSASPPSRKASSLQMRPRSCASRPDRAQTVDTRAIAAEQHQNQMSRKKPSGA